MMTNISSILFNFNESKDYILIEFCNQRLENLIQCYFNLYKIPFTYLIMVLKHQINTPIS